jgi:hypothetical protein
LRVQLLLEWAPIFLAQEAQQQGDV